MAGAYNQLGIVVDCPCGRNEFREFPALGSPGYVCHAVKCRACKRYYVILLRVRLGRSISTDIVGIRRLHGADSGSLRQALREFDVLTNDDIDFLVTVAESLSNRRPQPQEPNGRTCARGHGATRGGSDGHNAIAAARS